MLSSSFLHSNDRTDIGWLLGLSHPKLRRNTGWVQPDDTHRLREKKWGHVYKKIKWWIFKNIIQVILYYTREDGANMKI